MKSSSVHADEGEGECENDPLTVSVEARLYAPNGTGKFLDLSYIYMYRQTYLGEEIICTNLRAITGSPGLRCVVNFYCVVNYKGGQWVVFTLFNRWRSTAARPLLVAGVRGKPFPPTLA